MRLSSALSAFLLTTIVHAQDTCDAACQASFNGALATESSYWVSKNVSADTFYSTPANSSGAKPGDVLRWENIPRTLLNTNYTAPGGMSVARFLYMTEDIDRKPIPASGFVLLPYDKPDPNKPFNVVAWAHGTAGRGRTCAPSNHKDLYHEWRGPFSFASAGYAVIATDYSGQGSDIPQGFMYEAGYLHAADIAYSVVAARKVIGDLLSEEWVVAGHSEGGMTAWRTNERLAMDDQDELLAAGKFLGTVALAPALKPLDLLPASHEFAGNGSIGGSNGVLFLQSLASLYPDEIRIEDYLTEKALARVPLMDQGCIITSGAVISPLTVAEVYKDQSFITSPSAIDWQTRYNGAGDHALAAPMLVLQGDADTLVFDYLTEGEVNNTCTVFPESSLEYVIYPGVNHFVIGTTSLYNMLGWINDRFNNVEAQGGCSKRTLQPATASFRDARISWTGEN